MNHIDHYNAGVRHAANGRPADAIKCYRRAIEMNPAIPEAHYNLANELRALGLANEAIHSYMRAIRHRSAYTDAYNNLGGLLMEHGRFNEAESYLRIALRIDPNAEHIRTNLGVLLIDTDRLDEAVIELTKVECAEAYVNLGNIFQRKMQLHRAIEHYRKALAINPDLPDAHHNLAVALLKTGQYAEGWREYEWRFKTTQMRDSVRHYMQPQWRGEDIRGKTLLVWAEQGFGDTIQFCRYAVIAASFGIKVILEVPQPLVRLMRALPGIAKVVSESYVEQFDYHCPMLSLPLAIPISLPAFTKYLEGVPTLRFPAGRRIRIGITWAGNPRKHSPGMQAVDKRRSMTFDDLAPILALTQFDFYNLQYGEAPDGLINHMTRVYDFADTASLIENLDLVITVDTAVAHLSAALGCPTWIFNRFDGCWRWLTDRTDSPWYPSVRLINQTTPGDWTQAVNKAVSLLHLLT